MATIRKRLGKWQVQIRRKNYPNIIKTFTEKSSADKYVREIEVMIKFCQLRMKGLEENA